MKEVFRHSDAGLVSVYQSFLESAGVLTFVRNAETQQALVPGLLTAIFPLPEFWPTLCVMKDEDYPAAMELLKNSGASETAVQAVWACRKCGEEVPGHFAECWNCRAAADR